MRVGTQGRLAHALEQLPEARVRRDTSARSTSVLTKNPISASSLRARAIRDRRADREVILAGYSGEAARRTPPAAS